MGTAKHMNNTLIKENEPIAVMKLYTRIKDVVTVEAIGPTIAGDSDALDMTFNS